VKTLGIYCGSFSPFHVGHLDIALKAKRMFDEVLIVRATNVDKKNQIYAFPDILKQRGFFLAVLSKDELLTDFVDNIHKKKYDWLGGDYNCVLIRGLRNEKDFEYEENLCAAYRMLKTDINIVHIFSDPKYNFVSSSLLRSYGHLEKFKGLIVK